MNLLNDGAKTFIFQMKSKAVGHGGDDGGGIKNLLKILRINMMLLWFKIYDG